MDHYDEFIGIEPIAIIGMSCRFPDADNVKEFWENLKKGKESVSFFTDEELILSGIDPEFFKEPSYVKAGCILQDIEYFDYDFFGYSKEEAELIDPQQRIFMECAYEALEDSGYFPFDFDGEIGLFGAMKTSGYSKVLKPVLDRPGTSKSFEAVLGTAVDQICLRTSHALNLKGPSIGVQTACSASSVATHLACESLRNRECDIALTGAAAILVPKKQGYLYDEEMITSPDGHCRALDKDANGTIPGNGVGIVVLKPLLNAINDNDNIYAVIKASAVNNDGNEKFGYRAPSLEGQIRVIAEALEMADVNADKISYVEANGTGTLIGDSIEIEALKRVFENQTDKKGYCGIGSVKSNIGHLTQSAGIAGIIKVAMALKNRKIPKTINCQDSNPKIKDSPFYTVNETVRWEPLGKKRLAVINSFAIGGANAHLVLEEFSNDVIENGRYLSIFTLSAKSEEALKESISKYFAFLKNNKNVRFEDICFTSNLSRSHYPIREYFIAKSKEELLKKLVLNKKAHYKKRDISSKTCFFLLNENKDDICFELISFLYKKNLEFRSDILMCDEILRDLNFETVSSKIHNNFFQEYNELDSFVIFYSLSKLFLRWGVSADYFAYDNIGSYVVSCLFKSLDLKTAINRIVKEKVDNSSIWFSKVITKNNNLNLTEDKSFKVIKFFNISDFKDAFNNLLNSEEIQHSLFLCSENSFQQYFKRNKFQNFYFCLRSEAWRHLLYFIGELYIEGKKIDWENFNIGFERRRVSLPTYCFEKKYCWYGDGYLRK